MSQPEDRPAPAMRLATVRHYTQAEVDAALQRLRSKPVYDDGLDEVGLVGNDFPQSQGRTATPSALPHEEAFENVPLSTTAAPHHHDTLERGIQGKVMMERDAGIAIVFKCLGVELVPLPATQHTDKPYRLNLSERCEKCVFRQQPHISANVTHTRALPTV